MSYPNHIPNARAAFVQAIAEPPNRREGVSLAVEPAGTWTTNPDGELREGARRERG